MNKPIEGAICAECYRDKGDPEPAIVAIGSEKTPLCVKHFDMFMEGFGTVIKRMTGILGSR